MFKKLVLVFILFVACGQSKTYTIKSETHTITRHTSKASEPKPVIQESQSVFEYRDFNIGDVKYRCITSQGWNEKAMWCERLG